MELRHLLYFQTLSQELHFRKAASKLCISQPPLSRQIKELEAELGVKLFERNTKSVVLTDAGKYLQKQAKEILSRLEESKHIIRGIHEGVSGKFRIGYISSTYHMHLSSVLKEMPNVFPYLKTRLYEVPTARQIKALEEGKLDIGILRTPVNSEKLKLITLFDDPFMLVIPENKRGFLKEKQLGDYLKSQSFIFYNQDYAPEYHRKLVEICGRMGFYPDVVHEANHIHSILRLVENDLGVSIVPSSIKQQYASLNLAFIDLPSTTISTQVVLAFKNQLHPATQWFIDRFENLFNF